VTSLIFEAPGAVIHAADTPRRTITGRLVTYGEYGDTSAGRVRFAPGSIELPTDTPTRVLLVRGHTEMPSRKPRPNGDGEPAGAAVKLVNTPEFLDAEFRVAEVPVGDLLLAEANPAAPIRGGLSVEVDDVEFDPADPSTVIRCTLYAAAAVPFQAYPSSRMTSVAASLHNPSGEPSVTAPTLPAPAPAPEAPAAPSIDYAQLAAALAPALASQLHAAAAPAGLPTTALPAATVPSPGLAPSAGPAPHPEENPVAHAAQLFASVARGTSDAQLHAALQDITNANLPIFQNRSTLGEKLWEGASYSRQFVSLMRQKQLTDWEFTGWQWVNRPRVQNYAGNKTEVPSNPVSTVRVSGKATRLAGAWDIDQKFVDFASPEFWEEFWAAGTESYLEESDLRAAAAIADYAVPLETPGSYPTLLDDEGDTAWTYALPAGYTIGAEGNIIPSGILRAAALATAVLEDTPRVRKGPDYIGMHTADWLRLTEVTNLDLPAFLSLLKVSPDQFMRSSEFAEGRLTAGVRTAATFRELGSVPIRVSAKNVAFGGVDEGLFGYTGISMDRPGGIISLPLTESV
jgi:hypothetical protein